MQGRQGMTIAFGCVMAVVGLGCGKSATNSTSTINANGSVVSQTEPSNAVSNTPNVPANVASDPAYSPSATYRAAFEARKNKDVAGFRKWISREALEYLTRRGQRSPTRQTLDQILKDLVNSPQAATPQTRNERIEGNRAMLEYQDEDGTWLNMEFIKEDGVWKLTIDGGDELPLEGDPELSNKN